MRKRRIIVTADDFGLSPGINASVVELYRKGALSRASLFANCRYTEHAVSLLNGSAADMPVGIHLALTCGRCSADPASVSLLAGPDGVFTASYFSLLFYSCIPFLRVKLFRQISHEFEAQFKRVESFGLAIRHVDSHQHVHMIPGIFRMTAELAGRFNIKEIRVVDEDLFCTIRMTTGYSFPGFSGLAKHFLLKTFRMMSRASSGRYFFSILHSCRIHPSMVRHGMFRLIPDEYSSVEIMLHPGDAAADELLRETLEIKEISQVLSQWRRQEFHAALAIRDSEA